jgi:hypothetical protein
MIRREAVDSNSSCRSSDPVWQCCRDAATGQTYYLNGITQERTLLLPLQDRDSDTDMDAESCCGGILADEMGELMKH